MNPTKANVAPQVSILEDDLLYIYLIKLVYVLNFRWDIDDESQSCLKVRAINESLNETK